VRSVNLIVREDPATGATGLMCKDVRVIDAPMVAVTGSTIAHDIIEHQNGLRAIGSIGDELEALGGLWFCRGQLCDLGNGWMSNTQTVSGDVDNLFSLYASGVPVRSEVKRLHRAPDYIEDDIGEILAHVGVSDCERDQWGDFKEAAFRLISRGYNKAVRRFKDNAIAAHNQFCTIEMAVNDLLIGDLHLGQEFTLVYGEGRARTFGEYEDNAWY